MYSKYPNDHELALQYSLHPTTEAEKRLADAFLAMEELVRDNQNNCVFCGAPHD